MLTKKQLIPIFVLLTLDYAWLHFYMKHRYIDLVKIIQKSKMNVKIIPALFAYLFMIIGLLNFVLPNIKKGSLQSYFQYGFLFGVILYGVYNFTCAAVFNNWDITILIQDILWGGFVYFIASYSLEFI